MNDYITIPLSKRGKYAGQFEAFVSIEDADLAELSWSVQKKNSVIYAVARNKKTMQYMHRVIMERILGRKLKRNEHVDHINGDGLLNTRDNLRLANKSLNAMNVGIKSNNTSGYKGVTWHKRYNKWVSQIGINGENKHLGYFDTPEDAYKAYCDAADVFHGEFANY